MKIFTLVLLSVSLMSTMAFAKKKSSLEFQADINSSLYCKVPGGYELSLTGPLFASDKDSKLGSILVTKNGKSVAKGATYTIKFADSGNGMKMWVYDAFPAVESGVMVGIFDDGTSKMEGLIELKDGSSFDIESGTCEVE